MYPDPAISATETVTLNTPMNPEIKAKWLAALRSGEYKKGKGRLRRIATHLFLRNRRGRNAERFCCFGVLCDLYIKETGKGTWVFDSYDGDFDFYDTFGRKNSGMPTDAVYKWAGMQHSDVIVLDEKDRKKYKDPDDYEPKSGFYLAEQNDKGRTFKTIANVIEKYL